MLWHSNNDEEWMNEEEWMKKFEKYKKSEEKRGKEKISRRRKGIIRPFPIVIS